LVEISKKVKVPAVRSDCRRLKKTEEKAPAARCDCRWIDSTEVKAPAVRFVKEK
jgi:hypothetical protein